MLKKVKPGDPLHIPAEAYNAFIDAAEGHKAGKRGANRPKQIPHEQGIILVKNDSGGSLERFAPVGLAGPIITPAENLLDFQNRILMSAVAPTGDHAGRFAILLEPLAAGNIGRAVVSGPVVCQINVTNASHGCAEVAAGSLYLQSGADGSATILYKESGTGVKWAVVRLGRPLPAMPPTLNFQTRELFIEGNDFPTSMNVPFTHFISGNDLIAGAYDVFHVHFNNSGIYSLAVSAILRTTSAGIGNTIYFYAAAPGWEYTTHPVTITSLDQQITATTLVPGLPGTLSAMTQIITGIRFLYTMPYARIYASVSLGQMA